MLLTLLQKMSRKPGRAPRRAVPLQVEVLEGRDALSTVAFGGTLAVAGLVPIHAQAAVEQPVLAGTRRIGEEVPALCFIPIHAQGAGEQPVLAGVRKGGDDMPASVFVPFDAEAAVEQPLMAGVRKGGEDMSA